MATKAKDTKSNKPTSTQLKYLRRGLTQAGGKLPLFDEMGQRVGDKTVQACIRAGWAEPWFANPMKPDWLICKITDIGRKLADA
ncbi:MAG: hypothetical protein HOE62_21160 [Alphaproteobacteria bacterium]|nr:hypothetical protein [Alphaproteobacteria bacterium]MBT4020474.1 hypothetical protein [Alphaproteobacteria bacterium]MBT4964983.1 hypothetical protein [Alphaproteobacteria bacterium]MBT5161240.1 hypothetical protein [Alphaproteobacteria bacterium]MBT5918176.1 hypothetical protein [Alphaproteobacteria bacterium]